MKTDGNWHDHELQDGAALLCSVADELDAVRCVRQPRIALAVDALLAELHDALWAAARNQLACTTGVTKIVRAC